MAGPWEKYAAPSAAEPSPAPMASGPWAKYAQPSAQPSTVAAGGSAPMVPLYVPDGKGGEFNANQNAQTRASYDAMQAQQDDARAKEQAAFDATRTPMTRAKDAAIFAASVPIRAATRGGYGIGDAISPLYSGAGEAARQSEANFARANQGKSAFETWNPMDIPSLGTAADAGSVMAGVPMLSTMGAVPGQVMRTGAAAVRQLPGELRSVMADTRGMAATPGGPGLPPSGTVPPVTPAAAPLTGTVPTRGQTFEAANRLLTGAGARVDLPEMIVGSRFKQNMAAGLRSMPGAGEVVDMAYEKALNQLKGARDAAGGQIGAAAGKELTGAAIKQDAFNWITRNSKDAARELYEPVYANIDPAKTAPLRNSARLSRSLQDAMQESTGTAANAALARIAPALERPEGLNVRGTAALRTEIGDLLDESVVNNSPAQNSLKALYGALTEDLRANVRQIGGDGAARAWENANRQFRVITGQRARLAKVVGTNESKLSDTAVFDKALSLASAEKGDTRGLRLLQQTVGTRNWGDFGAQAINRMGIDPKTKFFSHDRYLSEYGKMSEAGKDVLFGSAKSHMDDIATIAMKINQVSSKFNRSETTRAMAVVNMFMRPEVLATHVGGAFANTMLIPTAAAHVGLKFGAAKAARQVAWSLARPAAAQKTTNVLRAYYRAMDSANKSAAAVAGSEQALAASVRAYAMEMARQTGGNATQIEAEISKRLADIRSGNTE